MHPTEGERQVYARRLEIIGIRGEVPPRLRPLTDLPASRIHDHANFLCAILCRSCLGPRHARAAAATARCGSIVDWTNGARGPPRYPRKAPKRRRPVRAFPLRDARRAADEDAIQTVQGPDRRAANGRTLHGARTRTTRLERRLTGAELSHLYHRISATAGAGWPRAWPATTRTSFAHAPACWTRTTPGHASMPAFAAAKQRLPANGWRRWDEGAAAPCACTGQARRTGWKRTWHCAASPVRRSMRCWTNTRAAASTTGSASAGGLHRRAGPHRWWRTADHAVSASCRAARISDAGFGLAATGHRTQRQWIALCRHSGFGALAQRDHGCCDDTMRGAHLISARHDQPYGCSGQRFQALPRLLPFEMSWAGLPL